ncbi:hypothetical protein A2810_01485 [candidate division Kazan bacterium RIFCSPHIGHO2_01_FULL_49_10]|uniref:Uncharacterized protein n=1 Tax=candidate division Kazan bacterium RIFCSPLOWO2_01_FULL_48_13 TaxID=1798539 RepID=A0A1F4PP71_UNCK3|nr:MAG: hypothetical protein A2810_01485 [candidate division Kazan bacterium RIFCSPHIGHO2_01_FULL_49_10]OGB85487.1 MAG: hypothetical protein A2994_01475 [candidate division Kazan bacterium RIFCSPLOWO2_01_FULL_48_13]
MFLLIFFLSLFATILLAQNGSAKRAARLRQAIHNVKSPYRLTRPNVPFGTGGWVELVRLKPSSDNDPATAIFQMAHAWLRKGIKKKYPPMAGEIT